MQRKKKASRRQESVVFQAKPGTDRKDTEKRQRGIRYRGTWELKAKFAEATNAVERFGEILESLADDVPDREGA